MKSIVERVAEEKHCLRGTQVTDGWWTKFLQRQPQLSLRRGDATGHVRMDSTIREAIEQYFDLLEETLKKHDLSDFPAQIYNMDESGVPLNPCPPNVAEKG